MSNIGKKLINIPTQVSITSTQFAEQFKTIKIEGKLGIQIINLPQDLDLLIDEKNKTLGILYGNPKLWGTTRITIEQAIIGVSTGFTKQLQLIGIGYRAVLLNNKLSISVGRKNPYIIDIPKEITISCPNPSTIVGSSYSYSKLSTLLNKIVLLKPATKDHYKGKGISY